MWGLTTGTEASHTKLRATLSAGTTLMGRAEWEMVYRWTWAIRKGGVISAEGKPLKGCSCSK
jgi:hypothetical protein